MERRGWLRARAVIAALAAAVCVLAPYVSPALGRAGVPSWPAEWQADSAFSGLWARSDGPVAMKAAGRSWVWGPQPFAVANEAYAESATGRRLVAYLDKARMEINDPLSDTQSPWFVTTGLLVNEMLTGLVQTGNGVFEEHKPAAVVVAGDAESPDAPTYANFAATTGPAPDNTGRVVSRRLARDGREFDQTGYDDPSLYAGASYDTVTRHNVPAVFVQWLNSSGPLLQDGTLVQGRVLDPLFVLGRPLTEAWWTHALVGGKPADLLVQLFERRALTYNPTNPPEWRVEMANVGRAYYDWRYTSAPPEPAISAEAGPDGVAVKGWRWPAGAAVTVQVELPGGQAPLAGPVQIAPDAQGRLSLTLPVNTQLQGALQARANLRVSATSGQFVTMLPLAANPALWRYATAGQVLLAERSGDGTQLLVRALDGKLSRVQVPATLPVRYGEGGAANAPTPEAGEYAAIDGSVSGAASVATAARLLSRSHSGAAVAYLLQRNRATLQVSGTGWPPGKPVAFSIGTAAGPGEPFATVTVDSRGNISHLLQTPKYDAAQPWLFATSTGKGDVAVHVAVPMQSIPSELTPAPPYVLLSARAGSALGAFGSYCFEGNCYSAPGPPSGAGSLSARAGEVVELRSRDYGSTIPVGPSPTSYTARLYPAPAEGQPYFTPAEPPVFSVTNVVGRPFSLALPPNLQPGAYALVLTAGWPGNGGKDNTVYGFGLEVR